MVNLHGLEEGDNLDKVLASKSKETKFRRILRNTAVIAVVASILIAVIKDIAKSVYLDPTQGSGMLHGNVYSSHGEPVRNAIVLATGRLRSGDPSTMRNQTDDAGYFVFNSLDTFDQDRELLLVFSHHDFIDGSLTIDSLKPHVHVVHTIKQK